MGAEPIEPPICLISSHYLTKVFELPCSMDMKDFEMCKVEVTYVSVGPCLLCSRTMYEHSVNGDRSKNFYMPSLVICLTLSLSLMYSV